MESDIDVLSMTDLRKTVGILRESAQQRLRVDRQQLWPKVSDREFNAVIEALGEISVIEAREALQRLELETLSGSPHPPSEERK